MTNASNSLPEWARVSSPELRARLTTIREAVEPILATNNLPHFTDHSVSHSDRLCAFVDDLTAPLDTQNQLSVKEAFALYASCYLHDVGMQHQKADETQCIRTALALPPVNGQRWADLSVETKRELTRKHHHRISTEMVRSCVDAAQPTLLGVQLTQNDDAGYIACLCEAHCINTTTPEYASLVSEGPDMRTPLLAALLRIADILDESRRRTQLYRELTVDLDVTSRMHWWRHYYVADISFDRDNQHITIWFDFPPESRAEYARMIPDLQIPYLRSELLSHQNILANAHLYWTLTVRETPTASSTAITMPDDVHMRMASELASQRRRTLDAERHAVLNQLRENRPVVQRSISALHDSEQAISPDEYLCRAVTLSQQLKDVGGLRDAWMILRGEYNRKSKHATPKCAISTGLDLCRMMLDDGMPDSALRELHDLQAIANKLDARDPIRVGWLRLFAESLVQQCDYAATKSAIQELISLLPPGDERQNWEARLVEVELLQGELSSVEAFLPKGDAT